MATGGFLGGLNPERGGSFFSGGGGSGGGGVQRDSGATWDGGGAGASYRNTFGSRGIQQGVNQPGVQQGPSQWGPGPISQYPGPAPGQMMAQTVNSYYGPQQQILADQLARQRAMLEDPLYGPAGQAGQATASANAQYNSSMAGIGLDRQGIGIGQNLTQSQLGNLTKLRGILAKQYGIQGEQLTNVLGGLKINETDLRDQSERKQWDLRSDLTARGAFNTVANERGTGRINRDLTTGLNTINNQRGAADIAHRGNILGLDEKGIGYDNQQASLTAQLSNYGLDMKRLSISEDQLSQSLEDGLYKIGLGGLTSLNGLMDAMGGTNTQQAQLSNTILQQILSYSGLPMADQQQIAAAFQAQAARSTSASRSASKG